MSMTTFKVNTYISILCITAVGALGTLTIVRVAFDNAAHASAQSAEYISLERSILKTP